MADNKAIWGVVLIAIGILGITAIFVSVDKLNKQDTFFTTINETQDKLYYQDAPTNGIYNPAGIDIIEISVNCDSSSIVLHKVVVSETILENWLGLGEGGLYKSGGSPKTIFGYIYPDQEEVVFIIKQSGDWWISENYDYLPTGAHCLNQAKDAVREYLTV